MTAKKKPYWARKPQGKTRERLEEIQRIVENHDEKLTVRAITYKLYGKDTHGKELERAYNTTCKDVVRARVLGMVPWSAISEERVVSGGGAGWSSLDRFMNYHLDVDRMAQQWRLSREPAHERPIQVWFEKSTVVNHFKDICHEYGVEYTCTRGQMPWTAKKNAVDELTDDTVILYFGDNDTKGREIRDVIERDLIYLAKKAGTEPPSVKWAGVTDEHEERFGLPANSRLDGLDGEDLKQMVAEAIQEHVDMGRLQEIIENQEEQREELRMKLQDAIGDDTE